MYHWRYRAIDKSERVHSGVIRGIDEPHAVLELRQRLLQVIELVDIEADEYAKESTLQVRMDKWRKRVVSMGPEPVVEPDTGRGAYPAEGVEPRAVYPAKSGSQTARQHQPGPRRRHTPSIHVRLLVLTAGALLALTFLLLLNGRRPW
jgi:hypothetical protein